MTSLRSDRSRGVVSRRGRVDPTRARPVAPIVSTLAAIAAVSAVLVVVGTPRLVVLAVVVAVVLVASVAARRDVADLSAGIGLLLIRPYRPGERVRLHSPERGATVEAEIVRIGLLTTTLASSTELLVVPNLRMLRTAPDGRR